MFVFLGEVKCSNVAEDCPKCPKPTPGSCRTETCQHYGREYRNGEQFTSPQDSCRKCVCQVAEKLC